MKNSKISGNTTLTGLLGNPVSHSISPIIHNHAYASLNLNYCYIPLGCAPDELENLVRSLRALGFAGANVTIPYKGEVLQHCDEVSEISQITGTVNTLFMKNGTLHGTTTDGEGFLRALREDSCTIEDKHVVILGNGGTARTLSMVLAYENIPSEITVIGRNLDKVSVLAEEVFAKTGVQISVAQLNDSTAEQFLQSADIVVNCTPVGMHPHEGTSPIEARLFRKDCYYFDAIYNPTETVFLSYAKAIGASYQNGLRMLLFQGLASSKYWTGVEVPADLFDLQELFKSVNGDSQ